MPPFFNSSNTRFDYSSITAAQTGRTYKHITVALRAASYTSAIYWQAHSESQWNVPGLNDPEYDAMVDVANAATTVEEFKRLVKEINMYLLKKKVELLSKVVFELKIKRQSGFQESPRFHQRIVHLQSPLPGNQSHVTFSNSFLHIVPA